MTHDLVSAESTVVVWRPHPPHHRRSPQIVTRRGRVIVVALLLREYEGRRRPRPDFKGFLLSGPDWSELAIERDPAPAVDR